MDVLRVECCVLGIARVVFRCWVLRCVEPFAVLGVGYCVVCYWGVVCCIFSGGRVLMHVCSDACAGCRVLELLGLVCCVACCVCVCTSMGSGARGEGVSYSTAARALYDNIGCCLAHGESEESLTKGPRTSLPSGLPDMIYLRTVVRGGSVGLAAYLSSGGMKLLITYTRYYYWLTDSRSPDRWHIFVSRSSRTVHGQRHHDEAKLSRQRRAFVVDGTRRNGGKGGGQQED